MSQVVENAKFSLLEVVTQLEDIWQEIGIKEDQKDVRSNTVLQHIQGILNSNQRPDPFFQLPIELSRIFCPTSLFFKCVKLKS